MEKTAPQEQGAVSMRKLWEQKGISALHIAKWLNVEEKTVAAWGSGDAIPNACQCVWLAVILDCTVKEIYLALLMS